MTMFVNRLQRGPFRLMSVALLLVAVAGLTWLAVTLLDDGPTSSSPVAGGRGGSGDPPAALTGVMNGVVRTSDAVPFADSIYTGGSLLAAVYYSNESVADVIIFYKEAMKADGWELVSSSGPELTEPNDKTDLQTVASVAFAKGSVTVSVSARTDQKDPDIGATRIGIGVEDKSLNR